MIGNVSIHNIEGTQEELAELKSLIDEVTLRCYQGDRRELIADLAEVIKAVACECPNQVFCRQLIDEIESWANTKLAKQVAEEFLDAIDEYDSAEDCNFNGDDWDRDISCDRSARDELFYAHCSGDDDVLH
jgi:hypothetical protein